ncbi:MAG: right-handed parallel beta-helix repeat-containing protein [Phycisphaerales bacterium]
MFQACPHRPHLHATSASHPRPTAGSRIAPAFAIAASALALVAAAPALAGGGSTTLSPANSIQATINSGQFSEIILGPGTYAQTFEIDADDLPLTIRSTNPADDAVVAATVINGAFFGTSTIRMVGGVDETMVFDGITVANGEATTGGDRGGAMFIEDSSPIIRRSRIIDSVATSFGGGVWAASSDPLFEDCVFAGNRIETGQRGGAMYVVNGTATVRDCRFVDNFSLLDGGAIFTGNATVDIIGCTFTGNEAGRNGGAIHVTAPGRVFVSRSTFSENVASDGASEGRGGAIYYTGTDGGSVENSVFHDNVANRFGASFYTTADCTLTNTTHVGELGSGSASVVASTAGVVTTIRNAIVTELDGQSPFVSAAATDVQFSLIEGGFPGTGNIGGDSTSLPIFVNRAGGDLRLAAGSPGIDAAQALIAGEFPTDADGRPRGLNDPATPDTGVVFLGVAVDMGAYEFQPAGGPPSTCPADLDGNNVVDFVDLLGVLSAFGSCP